MHKKVGGCRLNKLVFKWFGIKGREGQTGRLPARPRAQHGRCALKGGRGKPLPYVFLQLYKLNARSAIVFRFLLSQKEPGVYGGSAPVTLREAQSLRAEHG